MVLYCEQCGLEMGQVVVKYPTITTHTNNEIDILLKTLRGDICDDNLYYCYEVIQREVVLC